MTVSRRANENEIKIEDLKVLKCTNQNIDTKSILRLDQLFLTNVHCKNAATFFRL